MRHYHARGGVVEEGGCSYACSVVDQPGPQLEIVIRETLEPQIGTIIELRGNGLPPNVLGRWRVEAHSPEPVDSLGRHRPFLRLVLARAEEVRS